jgi:hypothetical protein
MGYVEELRKIVGTRPLILVGVAADGRETVGARFFKLHELPEALSPILRDLIARYARKLSQ